jgi:small subunit ribosomal protein S20
MPNIASARKRLRQNIKRRAKNRSVKSELRTEIRQVREAADGGKLDHAEAERIIHPNRAARLKSRLSAHLKTAKKK